MATPDERFAAAIRQMASFSVVDNGMSEMLHRIAVLANETVDAAAMVGLTMSVNGRPATPIFTDEAAPEIDGAQYETGIGPCLDSFNEGVGEQLSQALESRIVIEQAKGLLMATGLTSAAAFDLLKQASQRENRKLRDIAARIIEEAERRATSS